MNIYIIPKKPLEILATTAFILMYIGATSNNPYLLQTGTDIVDRVIFGIIAVAAIRSSRYV